MWWISSLTITYKKNIFFLAKFQKTNFFLETLQIRYNLQFQLWVLPKLASLNVPKKIYTFIPRTKRIHFASTYSYYKFMYFILARVLVQTHGNNFQSGVIFPNQKWSFKFYSTLTFITLAHAIHRIIIVNSSSVHALKKKVLAPLRAFSTRFSSRVLLTQTVAAHCIHGVCVSKFSKRKNCQDKHHPDKLAEKGT